MKPKSFNRDMKKELAGTLAAHGVAATIACTATAGAWDYARWWTLSLISGLSVLLRLPTADPGPEPDYVFRGPLEAAADAAASGQAGELLAALALVAASVLALGFVSWGRSWARLHDGTFAGDRAPTRTHGDAWLESRPSRVARRCPPWDGKAAAEGLVAAGCIGGGIAMVPAVHCLIRAGSGAGKSRRALAPSIAAAIDRNAHGVPTSVIVHDPKSEIRAWTEPLARRAGMEVVAIRLDEPVKSARFNPLDRAIAALGTEGVAGAVAELRELSSSIVPDAFSSGQRFFTDASRNLLTGLCLLAITDGRIPDGARNLSTVLALLEPRDGKSAVKSLEELAADLPAGNPARQFLLVASSNGGGGEALVSTARNYLMSFCDDDVSRMLWDGEVDLASVGRRPTILYIASATDRGDRGAHRLVHLLPGAVGTARDRAPVRRQAAGGDPARHRRGVRDPQDPPPPRRPRGGPQHRAARRLRAPEHPSARGAMRLLQGGVGRAAGAARHPGRPLGGVRRRGGGDQQASRRLQRQDDRAELHQGDAELLVRQVVLRGAPAADHPVRAHGLERARERRARDRRGGPDGTRQPRHHRDVPGTAARHDVAGGRGRAARAGARGGGPEHLPGTGVALPGETEKAQGVAVRRQEAQGIRRARRVLMRHTALPAKTARRHTAREARMTAGRGSLSVYLPTLPAETNSARRVAPQNPGRP